MADARRVAGWQALLNTLDTLNGAFSPQLLRAAALGRRRVPGWLLCPWSRPTVARARHRPRKIGNARASSPGSEMGMVLEGRTGWRISDRRRG